MEDIIKTLFASTGVEVKSLIASFILTIILGIIIIPILKRHKVGQVVRDDGPKEHLKKSGTPTMGGIIMLISIIAISIVVSFKYKGVLPVALVTLGYGLVGFIDDFIKLVLKNSKGLKPSLKMLGLIVIATAFVIYLTYINFGTETYIPIIKEYVTLPVWLYIPNIGMHKQSKPYRWARWLGIWSHSNNNDVFCNSIIQTWKQRYVSIFFDCTSEAQ